MLPGVRIRALFEVVLCSGFPTQLLIAWVLASFGIGPFTVAQAYSMTFLVILSLTDAALLVGLVLLFLTANGERPRDVLLGRGSSARREVIFGLLLILQAFIIAVVVLATIAQFAPSLHNVADNPLEGMVRSPGSAVTLAVVAIVSGGVREEVQRAFILHRFEQYLGGAPLGLLLFSLVFGSGHAIQGWDAAVTTAVLGLFWGVVYLARRSIIAPMVSHAGFDVAQIVRVVLTRGA